MTIVTLHHATKALLDGAARLADRCKAALLRYGEHAAESRMRRAHFEIEMYRGVYRHSSKNDDDLPAVR
jgi:hypothetical protein